MSNTLIRLITGLLLLSWQNGLMAQEIPMITIDQCYEWANTNYPMVKQLDLIDKTSAYNLSNAAKGYLPQININGQATLQSDVTSLPFSLPNFEIPTLDKDQYKIYAEVYQPLTNGPAIRANRQQLEATAAIEKQRLTADLHQLKGRVNQLYFGILLIDKQLDQLSLLQDDIERIMEKTAAAIANGTATETNQQLLQAELINVTQKTQESKSNRMAFVKMLAALTGENITDATTLEPPLEVPTTVQINRPELRLFDLQNQSIDLKLNSINKRLIPNIGVFLQAGYGRPALNFLSNDFDTYYVGGLKLNWNLSNLYSSRNDRQILSLSRQMIANQRATFLLNTNLTILQQSAEITKYENLIHSDQELISIRQSIKETAEVQLSNGLITALDYITYINAENRARQNLVLHETQLLLAQYNLKTTAGN